MTNKNVLVLGGNGYVGSRLYDYLLDKGYNVDNVDLCWFGQVYPETWVIDFKYLTKEQLSKYSHIVLLAGHSAVNMCTNNLNSTFSNNVMNLVGLLDKISADQVVVYASTAAVYGSNPERTTEASGLRPALNFYDYTKITAEEIIRLNPTKKIVSLRFGSIGGFSKNMRGENLMNSLTIRSTTTEPMIISTPNAMRAVLGMSDVCRAIETVIANDIKKRVYNLVSVNDSILNFANGIQQLSGAELVINDSFPTDYSFHCSAELFTQDYNFTFNDTVETIYREIANQIDEIQYNIKRTVVLYV
jgi:nucleoside-diphosphate-sugar epimerase